MLTLLATVIMVDQAAKWWAWRHVPGVIINSGGDFLTGPTIGRWYANPVTGALLLLATARLAKRAANRPADDPAGPALRKSLRARAPAVAVAGAPLIMTVALGAAHHGSLTKPSHISTQSWPQPRLTHEPERRPP